MVNLPTFEWFKDNSDIAQWIIAIILAASAILVIWQIHKQTQARKGANFVKVIELLNDEKMIHGIESVYSYSSIRSKEKDTEGNPIFSAVNELKTTDEFLPSDIKKDVIKIRETYNAVGVMLASNLIDVIPFLKLQTSQARDMWDLLYENIEKVRNERQKNKNDVPLWKGFQYVGELTKYWSIISLTEKLFFTIYPSLIPWPNSGLFKFRILLHEKFNKDK